MNNFTVSLETAKKLKEAGFKETYFKWAIADYPNQKPRLMSNYEWGKAKQFDLYSIVAPAPTLSELLEELPDEIKVSISSLSADWLLYSHNKNIFRFTVLRNHLGVKGYAIGYDMFHVHGFYAQHENPVEATALLWLKLKHDKLI